MFLRRLEIENFRSCVSTAIEFQPDVTVLVGENNSGKSNVIDALRLALSPLGQRRGRFFEPTDFSHDHSDEAIRLRTEFSDLTPVQQGHYIGALRLADMSAVYTTEFSIDPSRPLQSRPVVHAGPGDAADAEPMKREQLCCVYLEPLRDAQRELDSASSRRLANIIEYLTKPEDIDEFVESANEGLRKLEDHPVIRNAEDKVQVHLSGLTEPVRGQRVGVRFTDFQLRRLAAGLRLKMAEAGLDMGHLADSGLGYANALYIATVLLELQNAVEAELTVLLVEEPEAHLHPQLQAVLLAYLREHASKSGGDDSDAPAGRIQVVVTTHSPIIASSVPVDRVVVLRTQHSDDDNVPASTNSAANGIPSNETATRTTAGSKAIAIANLGLDTDELRKIGQYLDATKAALLFGRRVILVEGVSEAVLLPVLAQVRLKSTVDSPDSHVRAFAGVSIVNVGSVDFAPYARLLLTPINGVSILDRLVVVTDADPHVEDEDDLDADGDEKPAGEERVATRLERLEALAAGFGNRLIVKAAKYTLEADLLGEAVNEPVLRAAFLLQKPRSSKTWQEFIASSEPAAAFYKRLHGNRGFLAKGQFAHDVALRVADEQPFKCPSYLADAIDAALGVEPALE